MGRFIEKLKYAFAVGKAPDVENKELPEPLDRLARAVVDRNMEMPAIVLLESIRPLNFLASQTMHAAWPLIRMAGSFDDYRTIATALEDRETLQRLAGRIEELSLAKHNTGAVP